MASLFASFVPAAASACTDIVIYQPFLAGFLVYQVASGAYTIYWFGSAVFELTSVAVHAGVFTAKTIYQRATGRA